MPASVPMSPLDVFPVGTTGLALLGIALVARECWIHFKRVPNANESG